MRFAIDLVLAGIVLLCAWRGFKTGIINGICGIIAVVLAIYGGNVITNVYAEEFCDMLDPFITGVVDIFGSTVTEWEEGDGEEERPKIVLTEEEKRDSYKLSFAILRELGASEIVAEDLALQTAEKSEAEKVSTTAALCDVIAARLSRVCVFAVVFILIAIVFSAIGNVFDLSFGLPGFETLNHISGAVLGAVKGVIIIMVLACFLRYLGFVIPEEELSKTLLARFLMESNKIAGLLGI